MALELPKPSLPALLSPKPELWRQGEHVALIGDTGTGKSYLAVRLAQLRDWVIFIRTKRDDNALPGFVRVDRARSIRVNASGHWLLDVSRLAPERKSYEVAKVLDMAFREGGWTVVIDELWYLERKLGVGEWVDQLTTQGRSERVSVVTGVQRPAWVSKFAFAEATHFVVFRVLGRHRTAADVKAIRDMLGDDVAERVLGLEGHRFVYVQRPRNVIREGEAGELDRILVRG